MAVTCNLFWRHLVRHPELRRPEVTPGLLSVRDARYNTGLVVYPAATLLGLLSLPLFLALRLSLASRDVLAADPRCAHPHRDPAG